MRSLKEITLSSNGLSTLSFLNGHGKLQKADLSENRIAEIPPLYGLISLTTLIIKYASFLYIYDSILYIYILILICISVCVCKYMQ